MNVLMFNDANKQFFIFFKSAQASAQSVQDFAIQCYYLKSSIPLYSPVKKWTSQSINWAIKTTNLSICMDSINSSSK